MSQITHIGPSKSLFNSFFLVNLLLNLQLCSLFLLLVKFNCAPWSERHINCVTCGRPTERAGSFQSNPWFLVSFQIHVEKKFVNRPNTKKLFLKWASKIELQVVVRPNQSTQIHETWTGPVIILDHLSPTKIVDSYIQRKKKQGSSTDGITYCMEINLY